MAVKVSQMPVATLPLTGAEEVMIVQAGVSKKTPQNSLVPFVTAQFLVLTADGTLAQERVFTPDVTLVAVDNGPGATYTLGVDQNSNFNWAGVHRFLNSVGVEVQNNEPLYQLDEADAAANNRVWQIRAVGEQLALRAYRDDLITFGDAFTIDRTNENIDLVNFPGTVAIDTLSVVIMSVDDLTVNGILTVLNVNPSIVMDSTFPEIRWNESDAAVDNRLWTVYAEGEQLVFATMTDVGTTSAFLTIDRASGQADNINFRILGAPALQLQNGEANWSLAAVRFQDGTVVTPSIAFVFDLNLGLYRQAADVLGLANLAVLSGPSNVRPSYFGGSPGFAHQGAANNAFGFFGRFENTANGASLALAMSRNAAVGSHTIVQSGDSLGDLTFLGSDGVGWITAARILGFVDGTPGVNDMPGRLGFFTTADGAASATERMRVSANGKVRIGNNFAEALDSTDANLEVVFDGTAKIGVRDSTDNVEVTLFADATGGFIGTRTNHDFKIFSNNTVRVTLDADGSDLTVTPRIVLTAIGTGGTSTFTLNMASTLPGWQLFETDAAANNQLWDFFASSEQLVFRLGDGAAGTWLTVDRTAGVVDQVKTHAITKIQNTASGEQLRMISDNAYLSFYNAAESTRIGYIQCTSSSMFIEAEDSNNLDFRTGTVSRLSIEADGSWNIGGSNGNSGDVLTSAGGAAPPTWTAPVGFAPVTKIKSAQTDKTADTTLADDPHLAGWILQPSAVYQLSGTLHHKGNGVTNNGFKYAFDFNGQVANVEDFRGNLIGSNIDSFTNGRNNQAAGGNWPAYSAGVLISVTVNCIIQTQSDFTGGTAFDFQWAQQTSQATATSLEKGSWMTLQRIS